MNGELTDSRTSCSRARSSVSRGARERLPRITEFSELSEFINAPTRTY
jgi:ABC-type polysaccharide/polyol phosphate transport system ATPase subunit